MMSQARVHGGDDKCCRANEIKSPALIMNVHHVGAARYDFRRQRKTCESCNVKWWWKMRLLCFNTFFAHKLSSMVQWLGNWSQNWWCGEWFFSVPSPSREHLVSLHKNHTCWLFLFTSSKRRMTSRRKGWSGGNTRVCFCSVTLRGDVSPKKKISFIHSQRQSEALCVIMLITRENLYEVLQPDIRCRLLRVLQMRLHGWSVSSSKFAFWLPQRRAFCWLFFPLCIQFFLLPLHLLKCFIAFMFWQFSCIRKKSGAHDQRRTCHD